MEMPNAAGLILLKLLQNSALLLGVKKSVSSLYSLFAGAEKARKFAPKNLTTSRRRAVVAREVHSLQVAGSSPVAATTQSRKMTLTAQAGSPRKRVLKRV